MYRLPYSRLIPLLVLTALLQSCSSGNDTAWHGFVYFASGPYLGRLELESGRSRVVTNLGDAYIESVYNFGNNKLLLRTLVAVNGRDAPRIFEYDIDNGRTRDIFSGGRASYLEDSETVIYDDGAKLLAVPRGYGNNPTRDLASYRQGQLIGLLAIDGNRLLYETRIDGERRIKLYNYSADETSELEPLSSRCTLRGAVWVQSVSALACRDTAFDSEYMLATLDAEDVKPLGLPAGKKFHALAYAGDQDILLLSETHDAFLSSSPRMAVWVFDVAAGKAHRLVEHQFLGYEAAYLSR
jgi:hypothetical protein